MRYDVTTLGELVIDLVPAGSPAGLAFIAKPGGAPGNVAAGVSRLGLKAAMISKVGDEAFGRAAVAALAAAGVATEAVARTKAHNTALAVLSKDGDGDASYFFYRENCSDSNLTADEIPLDVIASSRILHVGTLPLAIPLSAAAQRRAIEYAKSKRVLISTDVNFRRILWRDQEAMRSAGLEMVGAASFVKASREELALMAGGTNATSAVRSLWHPGLILFAVTGGPEGAELFTTEEAVSVPGFTVETVDTVGCGDAFMASLLADLVTLGLVPPRGRGLRNIAIRACAAGAVIATRSGALESMPNSGEIDVLLVLDR